MSANPDLFDAYEKAQSLLAEGELKSAADICRKLLDADPDFAYGYHLMASLFRATGTLPNALNFAQLAVKLAPGIATFHMQEGEVWLGVQAWEQAGDAFSRAHELEPHNPKPLLRWAQACAQDGRFAQAQALIARARALGDIEELDECEGECLLTQGDLLAAEHCFDRMITRQPENDRGYFYKGKALFLQHRLDVAEAALARALKKNPHSHEALHCMAMLQECQGHALIALRYAMDAIQSQPQYGHTHLLLGQLLLQYGQEDAAEQILRQAQSLQPHGVYLMQLVVKSLCLQHKVADAVALLETYLAARPRSEPMQFMRAALKGEQLAAAPLDYISGLYDGMAECFDYRQRYVLSYEMPMHLATAVRTELGPRRAHDLRMLDLGCGTGLAAQAFKPMVSQCVGVDISDAMLKIARSKQLYNELFALDMVEFMQGCDRQFDLAVAADSLRHSGDVSMFLRAARTVLNAQGVLAFSVETHDGLMPYVLSADGSFIHSPRYIAAAAQSEGYQLLKSEDVVLRMDRITPVYGTLFLFKKASLH